jgi:spore germination protein KB
MPNKNAISLRQFTVLVLLMTVGDSLLVLPAIPASEAKHDAWISALAGLVFSLPILWLFGVANRRFQGLSLIEYVHERFGRTFGTVLGLLFLIFPLTCSAVQIREIGDFMITHILPETPIQAIHLLFIAVILFGAAQGLEPIARTAEILFPWFLLLFTTFVLFLFPQIDFRNIQPVLGEGVKPVLRGALTAAAFPYTELVILLMIAPYVTNREKAGKSLIVGAVLGGLVLITVVSLCICVLGHYVSGSQLYPTYTLAKKISVGLFLERLEAIMAIMWFISAYFKITIYVYALHLGIAQTFKLNGYKPLLLPGGMLLVSLSIAIAPNIVHFQTLITRYWPYLDFLYAIVFPLVVIGAHALRKAENSGPGGAAGKMKPEAR